MTDDVPALRPVPANPANSEDDAVRRPARGGATAAAGRGFARFGRWSGGWARRLGSSLYFWVGLVVGFGTSLQMWELVLPVAILGWIVGVWLWARKGRAELIAISVGVLLGWVPMLILFIGALPHTMIGPPGVRYDL